ncbi:MAG: 50S ribosomal protein L30 [Candidatus Bathyarchaeota archaeon]
MSVKTGGYLAVIRIRGSVGIDKEREYVFKLSHLTRRNHAVLVKDTPSNVGSIRKIKDYATWGEVTADTVFLLLKKRGMLEGGKKLTDDYVKEVLGYSSIKELSEAIYGLKVTVKELPKVKPLFRLHPPTKGFHGSTKKPYPEGELGYRGEAINQLIAKMV